MITEDYVSFETAKLLKEKGFDWDESPFYSEQDRDEWRQNNNYTIPNTSYNPDLPFDSETITLIAPHVSLQMAMKWLREKYNLHCNSDYDFVLGWYCEITSLKETVEYDYEEMKHYHPDHNYGFSTPEEACEEAVKYCLENLV